MLVEVPPGDERSVTFTFSLPRDAFPLVVEPMARVPTVTWQAGETAWEATKRWELALP